MSHEVELERYDPCELSKRRFQVRATPREGDDHKDNISAAEASLQESTTLRHSLHTSWPLASWYFPGLCKRPYVVVCVEGKL